MSVEAPLMKSYISSYRGQSIKMSNYFMMDYLSDRTVKEFHLNDNVANDYARYLKGIVRPYHMTNEEFRKYRCNPWYLSQDLYDTTEFWFMLLHLNEMYSATEFTLKDIKVYSERLPERLNDICNVTAYYYNRNNAEYYALKKDIIEGIDEEE